MVTARGPRGRRQRAQTADPAAPPARATTATRRIAVASTLLGLAALLLAARVLPSRDVVLRASGEVRLLGVDPQYHLRHILFVARNFPHLQRWDVGAQYPDGQRSNATGLFDLAVGGGALALSEREPSADAVARVAAWAPAVLGVLAMLALFALGRPLLGRGPALLACAIFLLYPGDTRRRTLFGFADHHAAEILLSLLVAAGLVRIVAAASRGRLLPGWGASSLAALPLVLFLFTWNGAPLHLLTVGAALLAVATLEIARGADTRALAGATLRYGMALLVPVAAVGLLWPEWVMEPGSFGLVLAACALLALGPTAWLALVRAATSRGAPPAAMAVASLLVLVGLAAGALWLLPGAAGVLDWLLATKSPIVSEHRRPDLAYFWHTLGPAGLLALPALPLALAAAWRRPAGGALLVPVVHAALWVALWTRTGDYSYVPPPFVALLAALTLAELARAIGGLATTPRRALSAAAVGAALVLPIWPWQSVRRPWPEAGSVAEAVTLHDGWVEAMGWLREATPAPTLPVDARVPPWGDEGFAYPRGTYGVLAGWQHGNLLPLLGRRPAVSSRYVERESSAWWLAQDEAESLRLLCPTCREDEEVRYVVSDAESAGNAFMSIVLGAGLSPSEYQGTVGTWRWGEDDVPLLGYGSAFQRSMISRLHLEDGRQLSHYRLAYESPHRSFVAYRLQRVPDPRGALLAFGRLTVPLDDAEALARHAALVRSVGAVESEHGPVYQGRVVSSVKVFERVEGAHLVGLAPLGMRVEAHLALRALPTGRIFFHARSAEVGEDGSFEVVVPYPTQDRPEGLAVESVGSYTLHLMPVRRENSPPTLSLRSVDVTEQDVREGRTIELGPLL